jgi:hypothetical protein
LGRLLKYVNAKKKDLRVLVHVHANGTNFHEFVYKKIITVRVRLVQFVEHGKRTIRHYYYEEDGFSLQEVSNHLNQRTRTCHMFVGNNNYTDDEISQNIELLRSLGILRLIRSYDIKQPLYTIGACNSFQKIRDAIWNIHNLQMYHLLGLKYKITDVEKEGLNLLFGKVGSYKVRKLAISNPNMLTTKELKRCQKWTDTVIDRKIKTFYDKYQKYIEESHLYSDMVTKLIIRDSPFKTIISKKKRVRTIQ